MSIQPTEKPIIPLETPGSALGFDPAVLAFGEDGKIVSQQQQQLSVSGGGSLETQQRRLEELQREVIERERRLREKERELLERNGQGPGDRETTEGGM